MMLMMMMMMIMMMMMMMMMNQWDGLMTFLTVSCCAVGVLNIFEGQLVYINALKSFQKKPLGTPLDVMCCQ